MPPTSKISKLPPSVLRALDERLFAAGFGSQVELSNWLSSLGYEIGKSAVGDYAKRHRAEISARSAASAADTATLAVRRAELRLQLLLLAKETAGPGDLIERAERLLEWVERPVA